MAFHFEIYRIADNKTLATLIEALWLRMAPFVSRTRSLITSDPAQAWHVACGHMRRCWSPCRLATPRRLERRMREDLSALSRIDGYWEGIEDNSQTITSGRRREVI